MIAFCMTIRHIWGGIMPQHLGERWRMLTTATSSGDHESEGTDTAVSAHTRAPFIHTRRCPLNARLQEQMTLHATQTLTDTAQDSTLGEEMRASEPLLTTTLRLGRRGSPQWLLPEPSAPDPESLQLRAWLHLRANVAR